MSQNVQKLLEFSIMFYIVAKGYQIFQMVQKCSKILYRIFQKVRKCSRTLQNFVKVSKMFQNVQNLPICSKLLYNLPEGSRSITFWNVPKFYRIFQWVTMFLTQKKQVAAQARPALNIFYQLKSDPPPKRKDSPFSERLEQMLLPKPGPA